MKVLVTGATGFIGQALTKKLIETGCDVRALVRNQGKASTLTGVADVVVGDVTDPEAVERAVRGVEIVFAVAGAFREPHLSDERHREVNVDAVGHLMQAGKRHGVRRVVHCSTVGIHGPVNGRPASEQSPIVPIGIYEETKAAGEALALKHGRNGGPPVSVVRPTQVYGPGDTRLLKLFKLANKRRVVLIGPGTAGYHLLYIDDLVDAFLLAAQSRERLRRGVHYWRSGATDPQRHHQDPGRCPRPPGPEGGSPAGQADGNARGRLRASLPTFRDRPADL